MITVDIANVGRFDVEVWEDGSGEPLLYLHGHERHPGDAPFLRRLASGRRVLAPELPGYGYSEGFEHFHDVIDVALYYRTLIDSWGTGPIDVIGHSLGGMFAAELAAISPGSVRKLVLVDPFGVWLDDDPAQDPFGAADAVAAATWHGMRPDPEPSNFRPDPDDPAAGVVFSARNLGSATKFMWPIADRGLSRRLPYVAAPTLVVHGTADGLVPPSYAAEFARLIPDAGLVGIENAGHYPMVEQEAEFIATVEKFLEE